MMMAVRPELVAERSHPVGEVECDTGLGDMAGGGVYRWRSIGSRSASGVIGNPEAASAEKGERLFDAISTAVATKLCNEDLWQLPWQSEKLCMHRTDGERIEWSALRWRRRRRCSTCCATIWT